MSYPCNGCDGKGYIDNDGVKEECAVCSGTGKQDS